MKFLLSGLFLLVPLAVSFAGGSLGWEEVAGRLAEADPKLLATIQTGFEMNHVGVAVRLSTQNTATAYGGEVGQRVPPYEFLCKLKNAPGDYNLLMTIDDQAEAGQTGWRFIITDRTAKD